MKPIQLGAATICSALALVSLVTGNSEASSAAGIGADSQCARSITNVHRRIIHRHATLLTRCIRAAVEEARPRTVEHRCSRLSESGLGTDRTETIARERILGNCAVGPLPAWLGESCNAVGHTQDWPISDAADAADCTLLSGRCSALRAVSDLIAGTEMLLASAAPTALSFGQGGDPQATFGACSTQAPPPTTTTLPATASTTTTSTTTVPDTASTTTTLPSAQPASLVITEIMPNPAAQSDTAGEYFEVHNPGSAPFDLMGVRFRDEGSNAFTVADPVAIAPGGYTVLARSVSAADGLVDYVYSSAMTLGNSGDEIIAERDGVELDRVVYDGSFPLSAGAAMELAPSASAPELNDTASAWCTATAMLTDGDFGSPGSASTGCTP